jgi:hypothetical protein
MPFCKGDPNINRKGSKPGDSLTDYLRYALNQPNDDPDGPDKRTKGQAMMDGLVELASYDSRFNKNHDVYLNMLLDRIEGKPKQSMDINGNVSGNGSSALAMNPEKRLSTYAELQARAEARKLRAEEAVKQEIERKQKEAEEIRARVAAKQAESEKS